MLISEELTGRIIGAAIEVHRVLGPGLLESVYERCLCHELEAQQITFEREMAVPVQYKGARLDCGYRADLLIEGAVLVELKAIEELLPIHEAQLLTYMRLLGAEVGLLINFNTMLLKDGIVRRAFTQ